MDDTLSYPPIDPINFDLIIVGTGLPESILASAASAAGKTVLHLDPNPFYGAHFSSLPLQDLAAFLQSQSPSPPPSSAPSDGNLTAVELTTRRMYSDVEITSHSPEPLEHSRQFNLDLAGPRVLFCADSAVDLMLKSGTSQYMEFKSVDASFVCGGDGKLVTVPDSRSAIFKDTSLGLAEKTRLSSFFKLVEGHLKSDDERKISAEDLESPFVAFLSKMRLPPKIQWIILYALAMADYDQSDTDVCKDVLKTRDGINRLALYHSSVGRFSNALGALIYPIYGQGELPQGFCRRAAVKGCLYVLRMPVNALLLDKFSGSYKGVKVASGQELFSHQMVLGPSFIVPSPLLKSSPDSLQDVRGKVARGICITKTSVKPGVSNCLVIYPPKSLYPEQVTSVRVLQIGSSLAGCPSGMFVLYLSALCDDANQGKKSLHAAVNAIFSIPISGTPDHGSTDESENTQVKPTLLWSALYIQEMTTCSFESISSTPMPDGSLNYNDILDATKELFHKMFPDEEFFPETTFSEPEDGELDESPNGESLDS
ncbi:Rab escort protein [Actinidia chinensis var. chinensis]|uniref:Rab escort protein 1 n=1 Tax=Actinidia chinensis var. chinensis TaxID=1590841 RepID=A0A2R6Q1W2_ACTCC|nr:Rab escort protein [Actinidia chinensis var. chinensis]